MGSVHDIGVLGSGPAALSIAAACARRGASVTVIAPEPGAEWKPNYCLWSDEIPAGLGSLVEKQWSEALVITPHGSRALSRSYCKLDGRKLRAFFWDALHSGSVNVVEAKARALEPHLSDTLIRIHDMAPVRARVVIDASGAQSPFIRRVHQRPPAFQTAYGLLLHAPHHGFDPGRVVLMDFRSATGEASGAPSFLYVLPFDERRLFLEETALAQRPAMTLQVLRARLETRLESLGLQGSERIAEERCSIAMGLGLPVAPQAVVPFGAAASMVHPASGYLLYHVLRKAEPLADSILRALGQGNIDQAITAGHKALWPPRERAVWELYGFGLETLVSMNATEIALFFDAFFKLPQPAWSGFLGGTLGLAELASIMTRLFRNLPASVRWHLLRTGLSSGAAPLTRSVLQPGIT